MSPTDQRNNLGQKKRSHFIKSPVSRPKSGPSWDIIQHFFKLYSAQSYFISYATRLWWICATALTAITKLLFSTKRLFGSFQKLLFRHGTVSKVSMPEKKKIRHSPGTKNEEKTKPHSRAKKTSRQKIFIGTFGFEICFWNHSQQAKNFFDEQEDEKKRWNLGWTKNKTVLDIRHAMLQICFAAPWLN